MWLFNFKKVVIFKYNFKAQTGGGGNGALPGDHHKELDQLGIGICLHRNSYNSSDDLFAKIGFRVSVLRAGETFKLSEKCEEVLAAGNSATSWSPRYPITFALNTDKIKYCSHQILKKSRIDNLKYVCYWQFKIQISLNTATSNKDTIKYWQCLIQTTSYTDTIKYWTSQLLAC